LNIANKIFSYKQTPRAKLTATWLYGAVIVALSAWILHSFLEALLAACVTAIASWPLYRRFAACLPSRLRRSAVSLIFTCVITVFVLAPLVFAFGALLTEANEILLDLAAADKQGLAVPEWLQNVPLVGSWAVARWESDLAHPGAVSLWAQRTDPTALLGWAQSFGHFMARHVFIIIFTILVLFFLYEEGESLADGFRRALRQWIGARADGHIDLATRAVRASVNGMLLVGLFDGIATATAYAIVGVPRAAVWGAITGALALVPFLGYVAVIALALKLAMTATATPALVVFSFGCAVLFCGDKILRPVVAGGGTRLPFVWVLMGCLGGFEVLGLVGLVIGPVVLTLAREMWEQRVRDLGRADATDPASPVDHGA
jgi:predicted PurR-regulated permease PerM